MAQVHEEVIAIKLSKLRRKDDKVVILNDEIVTNIEEIIANLVNDPAVIVEIITE